MTNDKRHTRDVSICLFVPFGRFSSRVSITVVGQYEVSANGKSTHSNCPKGKRSILSICRRILCLFELASSQDLYTPVFYCRHKDPCPEPIQSSRSTSFTEKEHTMISPFWKTKLSQSAQNLTLLSAASIPGWVLLMQSFKTPRIMGKVSKSGCWYSGSVNLRICSRRRFKRGSFVTGRERKVIKSRLRIRESLETEWMKDSYARLDLMVFRCRDSASG